jgi:hypothetical protein
VVCERIRWSIEISFLQEMPMPAGSRGTIIAGVGVFDGLRRWEAAWQVRLFNNPNLFGGRGAKKQGFVARLNGGGGLGTPIEKSFAGN